MLNEHPGIAGLLRHLAAVGDAALVDALKELLTRDGKLTAHIVAHIAEVDSRRLYANAAFQSMHVYCVEALHMSDAEAYLRIHAGRAARAYPILLEMLADRQLHLTAIGKLVPFLTPDNHLDLLRAAIHKTKRQVEELIAARFARPDVPEQIRKVPAPSRQPGAAGGVPAGVTGPQAPPAGATAADASPGEPPRPALATVPTSAATVPSSPASAPAPAARPTLPPEPRRDLVEPLSAAAYKVQFTADRELLDLIREAQALLGLGDRELVGVIRPALQALVKELRKRKFAETDRPRARQGGAAGDESPRRMPAQDRREVAARDGHQCTFVDEQTGRRCQARAHLELDHVEPHALGGASVASNGRLLCSVHNRLAAEQAFGRTFMERKIALARASPRGELALGARSRGGSA